MAAMAANNLNGNNESNNCHGNNESNNHDSKNKQNRLITMVTNKHDGNKSAIPYITDVINLPQYSVYSV